MAKLRLSEKAKADLAEIAKHTKSEFGKAQAKKYQQGFKSAFERLVRFPKSGVERKDLKANYRSLKIGMHFAIYRISGDEIEVTSILHQSRELERHLQREKKRSRGRGL
tara:strand:+ start:742 stop:1068 length:327 start_codon:yes stop_codon:yes gene_type:complete